MKAARRLARDQRKKQLAALRAEKAPIPGIRVRPTDDLWFAAAMWVLASKRQGGPVGADLSALRPAKKDAFWEATEALKDLDPTLSVAAQRQAIQAIEQKVQGTGQKGVSAQLNLRL